LRFIKTATFKIFVELFMILLLYIRKRWRKSTSWYIWYIECLS